MEGPTVREKIAALPSEEEITGFLWGLSLWGGDTPENKNLLEMRRHEIRKAKGWK